MLRDVEELAETAAALELTQNPEAADRKKTEPPPPETRRHASGG
jgi:hypothetical protein